MNARFCGQCFSHCQILPTSSFGGEETVSLQQERLEALREGAFSEKVWDFNNLCMACLVGDLRTYCCGAIFTLIGDTQGAEEKARAMMEAVSAFRPQRLLPGQGQADRLGALVGGPGVRRRPPGPGLRPLPLRLGAGAQELLPGGGRLPGLQGVFVFANPWCPDPGSLMEGHRPPYPFWHRELACRMVDIWQKHDLTLNQLARFAAIEGNLYYDEWRSRL